MIGVDPHKPWPGRLRPARRTQQALRRTFIEFGRPQASDELVSFRGIDIFGTPADALVEMLRQHAAIEIEEEGHSVTAPDLSLALWRSVVPENDDDPDGRYFESVLVARAGYYG